MAEPILALTGRRGRPRHITTLTEMRAHRRKSFHPKWNRESGEYVVRKINIGAVNELTALLVGFKLAREPEEKEYLFWEIADLLWNQDEFDKMFIKNKWSWKIVHHLCRERWMAVGGAASSGKSWVLAGWAIVNWLSDPANTLVLVTSTDLKGARKRIYGAIRKLLARVPDPPCKVKNSIGIIAYYDGQADYDTAGIQIVTADKSKDPQAMGKLVGAKAAKIILIADEHDEMGLNVTAAAKGNLSKNQSFQMASLFNPGSRFNPGGEFSEPERGWDSVDVFKETEWRTKMKGLFIRLISEESPNIDMTPSVEYEVGEYIPGIVTQEHIDDDLDIPGVPVEEVRKSRNFLRFHAACFYDGDEHETVYADTELMRSGALNQISIKNPTMLAGVDPSYSEGGDKTVMVICEEGYDQFGQHCIQIKQIEYLMEDITDKVNPRTLQMAEKIKKLCEKYKVDYQHLGVDASSGAGTGICDMLRLQIGSDAFVRVQFGGAASDKRVSSSSKVTGKQRYKNRATELFMQGKAYLLGRQMFGIPPIIAKQMTQRITLEPTKGEHGLVFQVEPKKEFKKRLGFSPDEADAFFVAVETARQRRLFNPCDPRPQQPVENIARWLQGRRTHGSFADNRMGFTSNLGA